MTRRSARPPRRALAVVAGLALVVSACGNDDEESGESSIGDTSAAVTTAAAATTASTDSAVAVDTTAGAETTSGGEATKSEIVIAIALQSFEQDEWGPNTASVWEAWVNDNGGVNGHPVRVVQIDTKNDPAVAQAEIQEALASEDVIAFVGTNDQVIQAWYPLVAEAGIPSIGGPCFYQQVICSGEGASPLYFTVSSTLPAITQGSLVAGAELGASRYGGFVCGEIAACSFLEQIYQSTAPEVGLEYGTTVKILSASPDFTAECLAMEEAGIDYANMGTPEEVGIRFIEDCARQGYVIEWSLTNGNSSEFVMEGVAQATGGRVSGSLDGFPWWIDHPDVQAFRDAWAAYAPEGADYRSSQVTSIWSAFEVFRTAMAKASDDPTPAEVVEAMLALEDEDLGGLLPQTLNYTSGEPAPYVDCFFLFTYEGDTGPQVLHTDNASGNSVAEGDLKSECFPPIES